MFPINGNHRHIWNWQRLQQHALLYHQRPNIMVHHLQSFSSYMFAQDSYLSESLIWHQNPTMVLFQSFQRQHTLHGGILQLCCMEDDDEANIELLEVIYFAAVLLPVFIAATMALRLFWVIWVRIT
ncbi:hypothetical protein AKJ16_DCAP11680 [Drosera capensis]